MNEKTRYYTAEQMREYAKTVLNQYEYRTGDELALPPLPEGIELNDERRRVAAMALQGLLASGKYKDATREAIIYANALIFELNKTEK
jgi:hypothetical protein